MTNGFIHLNVHSEYSIADGLIRINELVSHAAKEGSFAVALTDLSNLFATVKFYKAAIKAGIKPIIGVHAYIQNDADLAHPHQTIFLCQNQTGYRHLMELVSLSYTAGQIQDKPLIRKEWIRERSRGLIAIAVACESDIAHALLAGHQELAETLCEYWMGVFPNRFYVEVTRTHRQNESAYLQLAVNLAERLKVPLVATNASQFLNGDDFEAHEARVCIHAGYTLNDPNRPKKYTESQYLKSVKEMTALFSDLPEALENSIEIAKRCNLELTLGKVFLPNYPVPAGFTIEQFLIEEAKKGLNKRFKHAEVPTHYTERLMMELSVINAMKFSGYFLIVADFIRWAKENGVPVGPGRGSGAGSLVAYALEITGLDPLQYDLLFERFLNPERVSMPDFDIDFCMEGRDRVIEYVANTYGRESVSQIITYGTMAAKAVIRDVGRVLGYAYGFVDKLAKLIPFELGITLDKALGQEALLRERYSAEEEVKTLIDLAKKLEGIIRNAGKHAGGVVIAPSKLTEFAPLYCDANEGVLITQFDKNDVEEIGLVKFDFLGLRTLTIIHLAIETINARLEHNNAPLVDITAIPMNDRKTFELLHAHHTTAVFQLESRGMKDLVRRLQPDNFEEIVALVSLFRPGPLQSGMVEDYVSRKHGRTPIEYLHPKLTTLLKPTYGIIIYQEQVTQIAQVLAGYTLGNADLLRRAMGKKKPEEMAKQRALFTQGAVERGVSSASAEYIFDLMEKFAGYGFNKSHAAAYAMLTYQTAWLKAHYPAAFMAAVLSSDMAHTDKIVIFVDECQYLKIKIHPPNINESVYKFTVTSEDHILYGLGAIKGVGEAAIASILDARSRIPFQDLFDLCGRVDTRKVSRRVLEALIKSGACDVFGKHRASLMSMLDDAMHAAEQLSKNRLQGQRDLFGESFSAEDLGITLSPLCVEPWPKQVLLRAEKETLGLYLSGHPLEEYQQELSQITTSLIRDLHIDQHKRCTVAGLIVNVRSLQTKKGDRMAFIAIDDNTGRQEVAIFSDVYNAKRELLQKDNLVIIEGEISVDEYSGGYKMRCDKIMNLEEARRIHAKYLKINVSEADVQKEFSDQLRNVLKEFQGQGCPVRIFYTKENAQSVVRLGPDWNVQPAQGLLDNLKTLCGEQAIELCY